MRTAAWTIALLWTLAAPAALAQNWGSITAGGSWTTVQGLSTLEYGRIMGFELHPVPMKLSGPMFEMRGFNNEISFGFRNGYQSLADVSYKPDENTSVAHGKVTRYYLPFALDVGPSLSLQRMLRLGRVYLPIPPALLDLRLSATLGFGLSVLSFVDANDGEYSDDMNLAPSLPIRLSMQLRAWFLVGYISWTREIWFGALADQLERGPGTFEVGGGFAFGFMPGAQGGAGRK